MSPSLGRHAAGFLVAPLVVPVVVVTVEAVRVATMRLPRGYASELLRSAAAFGTKAAPFAYAAALVLGVPILLALRAVRRLTGPWVVAVSTVVGAVAVGGWGFAMGLLDDGGGCDAIAPDEALAAGLAVGGIAGAIVSAVHCAVARVPLRRAAPPRPPAATSGASP